MAGIGTAVQITDGMTAPLMNITNSLNLVISAFQNLQNESANPINTSSLDGAKEQANEAVIALNRMAETAARIDKVSVSTPLVPSPTPAIQPSASVPIQAPVPVQMPIQWSSANNEKIFNTSGMERYKQESASLSQMLSKITVEQQHIATLSNQTDIFPDNMVADLQSVNTRIQDLKTNIINIKNNPINDIGADAVSGDMQVLRGQLSQALALQNDLTSAMKRMDVSAANAAYSRLNNTIDTAEIHIRDNINAQNKFNSSMQTGGNIANSLKGKIASFAAAYLSTQGVSKMLDLSDELTQTTARLNIMNDGLQTTQALQDMIFLSAERSRSEYAATADMVAKLGLRAKDAFNGNAETIQFVENLNKQFVIAGASVTETQSATLQLTQALGSGILRGEEFNAVFEAAPNVIATIADYLDVPIGKMKDMAGNGEITADIVKNALLGATNEINREFDKMPMTFAQSMTSLANHGKKAFQPVFEKINQLVNSEQFKQFMVNVINGLVILSDITMDTMNLVCQAANFIAENWSVIGPVVKGVATAIAIYYTWTMLAMAAQKALTLAKIVAVPIYSLLKGVTMANTAAQWGLNSALYACPLTWIILLIIAVIAVIYMVIGAINKVTGATISATGIICGSISVLASVVWNIIAGLLNSLIQTTWTTFVEPFIGIFEWVLNAMNGGFNSFGGAVANLLGQIISWFLSLGKVVTKIIDAIFGTDWTSGLNSLQDKVLAWGKNDNAITISRDAPTIAKRIEYGKAWNSGYKFGEGIDNAISGFNPTELFKDNVPNPNDYTGMQNSLDNIDKNTKNTGETTDEAREYLKYIRDIAEREMINRYTTAEIKVEMTNNNKISSNMDLDGVSRKIRNEIRDELQIAAEGVH